MLLVLLVLVLVLVLSLSLTASQSECKSLVRCACVSLTILGLVDSLVMCTFMWFSCSGWSARGHQLPPGECCRDLRGKLPSCILRTAQLNC